MLFPYTARPPLLNNLPPPSPGQELSVYASITGFASGASFDYGHHFGLRRDFPVTGLICNRPTTAGPVHMGLYDVQSGALLTDCVSQAAPGVAGVQVFSCTETVLRAGRGYLILANMGVTQTINGIDFASIRGPNYWMFDLNLPSHSVKRARAVAAFPALLSTGGAFSAAIVGETPWLGIKGK